MKDIKPTSAIENRLIELAKRRREIFSLPPQQARDAILGHPQPAALVHSLREEDLYFLIMDIGEEDALEIIGLASARQWEFLLDMGVWEKDRISLDAWTRWLNLLMRADPTRMVRWISEERVEEMEYYLFKNVQVVAREHDQDPSDFGPGFHTYDDVLYVRFNEGLWNPEEGAAAKAERDEFLEAFLQRLAADDHIVYHNMLMESRSVLPAEYEEEAYRMRNVRMQEKGFQPFEEAIGIYQPLPRGRHGEAFKPSTRTPLPDGLPVPLYPFTALDPDDLLARSLARIERPDEIEAFQAELAVLCNRIISADRLVIQEREGLRGVVRKACGYLGIGIESLAGMPTPPPNRAVSVIRRHPFEEIFRVGYGKAMDLKWRAEKWRKESWADEHGLALSFWGEPWLGVIGGLLIPRPLFFDNFRSGVLYREFQSMADIAATEKVLEQIIALDELFGLMGAVPLPGSRRMLTWESLLLTLWAIHETGYGAGGPALPMDLFRPFYATLWEGVLPARKISDDARERFMQWLSGAARLEIHALSLKFRRTLEHLFDKVESEYGAVPETRLDPRHIHLFMLS